MQVVFSIIRFVRKILPVLHTQAPASTLISRKSGKKRISCLPLCFMWIPLHLNILHRWECKRNAEMEMFPHSVLSFACSTQTRFLPGILLSLRFPRGARRERRMTFIMSVPCILIFMNLLTSLPDLDPQTELAASYYALPISHLISTLPREEERRKDDGQVSSLTFHGFPQGFPWVCCIIFMNFLQGKLRRRESGTFYCTVYVFPFFFTFGIEERGKMKKFLSCTIPLCLLPGQHRFSSLVSSRTLVFQWEWKSKQEEGAFHHVLGDPFFSSVHFLQFIHNLDAPGQMIAVSTFSWLLPDVYPPKERRQKEGVQTGTSQYMP